MINENLVARISKERCHIFGLLLLFNFFGSPYSSSNTQVQEVTMEG